MAVDQVLAELGLEEHQAWIVAHGDTDAPHVHVAVNRVHPDTGELWEADFDQTILYNCLRELEEEKGWHSPGPKTIDQLPDDQPENLEYWEKESEKLGREKSVRRWARERDLPRQFKSASSWEQVEDMLEEVSMEEGVRVTLEPRREQGMVLRREDQYAALSSIDPEISRPKLEDRFPRTWEEYQRGDPIQRGAPAAKESEMESPTADQSERDQSGAGSPDREDSDAASPDTTSPDTASPEKASPDREAPGESFSEESHPSEEPHPEEMSPEETPSEEPSLEEPPSKEKSGSPQVLSEKEDPKTTPSEKSASAASEEGREVPFYREVRIRAAPDLVGSTSWDELRRRLASHGLEVRRTGATSDRTSGTTSDDGTSDDGTSDLEGQPVKAVTDGEDSAPLDDVMPEDPESRLAGTFASSGRYEEKAASARASQSRSITADERSLRREIFNIDDRKGVIEKDIYGNGTEEAKALFRARPEARKVVFRNLVDAFVEADPDPDDLPSMFEERIQTLEEKALKEARLRASLSEGQRELLRATDRREIASSDWRRSEGDEESLEEDPLQGTSPVSRYRTFSEESQEELQKRMTKKARKKLRRDTRLVELAPVCDQIEEDLRSGSWREAADAYLAQNETRRQDLQMMIPADLEAQLQDACDRRQEENENARRIVSSLSSEGREAFEKARHYLQRFKEASANRDQTNDAPAQATKTWTAVGSELSEAEQKTLLLSDLTSVASADLADNVIQKARSIRKERDEEKSKDKNRDSSKDSERDTGHRHGGMSL